MAASRALKVHISSKRPSRPRQESVRRICDMAKAIVRLRAMLKPMRATAERNVVTRWPEGFNATEFASCSSLTASDGSALTMRTTASTVTPSSDSALRTRTATSGKLGSSTEPAASSTVMRRVNSAIAPLMDGMLPGAGGVSMGDAMYASEQLDLAVNRAAGEFFQVFALLRHQHLFARRRQLANPHASGLGEIHHAAWVIVAQVFDRDLEALLVHVFTHELDIAGTDVGGHLRQHVTATDQLELEVLAAAAEFQDVVDEPLHGHVAVPGRGIRGRAPGAFSIGAVERQHEMIHAADLQSGIAHAGRHAGTEHGGHHLRMACHVVLTGQQARGETLMLLVPVTHDVPELRQRRLRLLVVGRDPAKPDASRIAGIVGGPAAQNSSTLLRSASVSLLAGACGACGRWPSTMSNSLRSSSMV